MLEVDAGQGVRVRTPDQVEVRIVKGDLRRGISRGTPSTATGTAYLRDALDAAEFIVAAEVELAPQRRGMRTLRSDATGATEVEVTVSPLQSALVLVEGQGGVYAWAYPRDEELRPAETRRMKRTLVFSLVPPTPQRGGARAANRRGVVLDWIGDKLVEPVRAYVLKFAVNALVDVGVGYLEGDKSEGLISLAENDATGWQPGGAGLPALPQDKPAKILLMIHGTFSSTAGGFGHLLLTDSGLRFLTRARRKYDAILAFDHKTLEVDPQTNATALMDALEKLRIPQNSSIDAVAHSRGGLVYRTFAEQVLARRRPDIKLDKAVFVGCTNGGTHLAEPANWAAMLDLYTNAIMASVRLGVGLAGGTAISPFISSGIKTLGRFVQMFSEVAITDKRVPGLAAMQPTSATVKGLNDATGGLERLATYYAVTSNFTARVQPRNGITKEFAEFVLDRVTNRLFTVNNDLVVDTESMTTFGTRKQRLDAANTFAFGDTDTVYHTIYFNADRVPLQLSEWLELPPDETKKRMQPSKLTPELPQPAFPLPPLELTANAGTLRNPKRRVMRGSPTPKNPGAALPRPLSTTAEADKASPAPAAAVTTVSCHFSAEMERSPELKKKIPLSVTISREQIVGQEHETFQRTEKPAKVDVAHKIQIEVIGKNNCRVTGDALVDIDVPAENDPQRLRFTVEGVEKGAAEVLVEARQGARILTSFLLTPVFVESDNEPLRVAQTASTAPLRAEEPAVLNIVELIDSGRVTLRFDLRCHDPNMNVSESRTLPAGFSRDAYIAENFKEIENSWLTSGKIYDRFLLRLKANGIVMARELLPQKVHDALWQHQGAIRAIQVVSEEPFIPWELLYITDPKAGPEGKGFLCEWGLVRWLQNTPWPGRRLALNKDRVRYVIPSYVDPGLTLEGAVEERDMLKQVFGNPQPVMAESMSVAEFLQKEALNCDVLHFACHGEAAQRAVMRADLLMAGDKADTGGYVLDPLSADVVKTNARFASTGPKPLVFINACQTGYSGAGLSGGVGGFVDAFLRPFYSESGAGALVGALWSVNDRLAFTFAQSFYRGLQKGATLVEAVHGAREAAKGEGDLTWLAYTVYGDPFARAAI